MIALSTATLFLLLGLVTAAAQSNFIETVTGRQVPLHAIRTRLRKHGLSEISSRVFEVKDGRFLNGKNGMIDLHKAAVDIRKVRTSPHLAAQMNGRAMQSPHGEGYIRIGNGLIVSHMTDGEVLAVWADGMNLSPLDHAAHPGILVNNWNTNGRVVDLPSGHLSPSVMPNDKRGVNTHNQHQGWKHSFQSLARIVSAHQTTSCGDASQGRLLELAISTDNSLCAMEFGNDESRAITSLNNFIAAVEVSYLQGTCIRLQMRYYDGH